MEALSQIGRVLLSSVAAAATMAVVSCLFGDARERTEIGAAAAGGGGKHWLVEQIREYLPFSDGPQIQRLNH